MGLQGEERSPAGAGDWGRSAARWVCGECGLVSEAVRRVGPGQRCGLHAGLHLQCGNCRAVLALSFENVFVPKKRGGGGEESQGLAVSGPALGGGVQAGVSGACDGGSDGSGFQLLNLAGAAFVYLVTEPASGVSGSLAHDPGDALPEVADL